MMVHRPTNQKLAPKYFGLFTVEAMVGEVAYKLMLPPWSGIHPTFHVLQLKKHIGKALTQPQLPLVGTDEAMLKEPV